MTSCVDLSDVTLSTTHFMCKIIKQTKNEQNTNIYMTSLQRVEMLMQDRLFFIINCHWQRTVLMYRVKHPSGYFCHKTYVHGQLSSVKGAKQLICLSFLIPCIMSDWNNIRVGDYYILTMLEKCCSESTYDRNKTRNSLKVWPKHYFMCSPRQQILCVVGSS